MKSPRTAAVLVAGSANLDFVVRASHVPTAGETVLGRDFATYPGGKGANQAVACARAGGVATTMLLALGADEPAAVLERSLHDSNVTAIVRRVADRATGVAFICLGDDADNAISVAPGANEALAASDLPPLDSFGTLLLQLETPVETVAAYATAASGAGLSVVLNAAPAQDLPTALLAALDVLIVNEGELATLAGDQGSLSRTLDGLRIPCVVVTLGARGCCALEDGRFTLQPAFVIDALDTTAAGDTFCGAFVAARGKRAGLPEALRRASAAAALACTRLGAQSSIPTREEVDAFLESDPREAASHAELADYCGLPPDPSSLPTAP